MIFVEIKTTTQKRVKEDFSGFFFALTEGELAASEILKERYKVILQNRISGLTYTITVSEILKKSKSTNWQVSVQL